MRLHFWESDNGERREEGISISAAKHLLKSEGGRAWTEHYERDGQMFDRTPILIKQNNSGFKYNHHL